MPDHPVYPPANALISDIRETAREYEASEHHLQLTVAAARRAGVPVAVIAREAGLARQTVFNWSADYGQRYAPGDPFPDLPVQRPHAAKGEPVLILGTRRGRRLVWDGRRGTAAGYAGDRLGVSVPGRIVDVIAESWALAGDAAGPGRRPSAGDRVICDDGTLAAVVGPVCESGGITVAASGELRTESWWAIVLPGI